MSSRPHHDLSALSVRRGFVETQPAQTMEACRLRPWPAAFRY
jgi:hypothetical protein